MPASPCWPLARPNAYISEPVTNRSPRYSRYLCGVGRCIRRRWAAPDQCVRAKVRAVGPHESPVFDTQLLKAITIGTDFSEDGAVEQQMEIAVDHAAISKRELYAVTVQRFDLANPHEFHLNS